MWETREYLSTTDGFWIMTCLDLIFFFGVCWWVKKRRNTDDDVWQSHYLCTRVEIISYRRRENPKLTASLRPAYLESINHRCKEQIWLIVYNWICIETVRYRLGGGTWSDIHREKRWEFYAKNNVVKRWSFTIWFSNSEDRIGYYK